MKRIILAFGILALAAAGPEEDSFEYSDEDSGEDVGEQNNSVSLKEAEELVAYILNTTRKLHYDEARFEESVDILKNKVWPGLRSEIVTSFSEEKQKALKLFTSSKTDVSKCQQIFRDKIDSIVEDGEKTILAAIEPLYKKIRYQKTLINQEIDSIEQILTNQTSLRLYIDDCIGASSSWFTCHLKYTYKPTIDRDVKSYSNNWYDYADQLLTSVKSSVSSLLEKYDGREIRKHVYATVADCLLTFEALN